MKIVLALLLVIYAQSANAFGIDLACSGYRQLINGAIERPEPPGCASDGLQFADEYDFETCRSEMEEYQRKIDGYSDCLVSEQKQAIDQFNETVQSFNRKASN